MKIRWIVVFALFVFLSFWFYPKTEKKEYLFRPASFDAAVFEVDDTSNTKVPEEILKQSFSYLGEGGQAYAFLSSDNQYVLKIFKRKHLKPKWYISYLPNVFWFKIIKEKHNTKLLSSVVKAYDQAYKLDKDGCGLIFTHFDPSQKFNHEIVVQDKLGASHRIDLDHTPFLIQEKVIPFYQVLKLHLEKGEFDLVQKRINQIVNLYERHMDQGFYDQGIGVLHNNGFAGDKPVHLDVGRFVYDPSLSFDKEKKMQEVKFRIHEWVRSHHPDFDFF